MVLGTIPPLDTEYLSHHVMRWVVDSIEVGYLVSMDTDTVHSTATSWWLLVRSVCSPTMFCAAAGTSTRAQIHVAHDGHTGRPQTCHQPLGVMFLVIHLVVQIMDMAYPYHQCSGALVVLWNASSMPTHHCPTVRRRRYVASYSVLSNLEHGYVMA